MPKQPPEKKPLDPIAEIRAELADYEQQRANAQQQAQIWRDKAIMADAAHQACTALLKKLEKPDETPDPVPTS